MSERLERLRKKASGLPFSPGVYIMLDSGGEVIYVGKSSSLKNRVSQYFQNTSKGMKTDKMVENIHDFEYILCDTEAEALALENSKIKQYSPKYNIKLKDDKNYPYIKITKGEYPSMLLTRKRLADGGKYFGPYSSATVARSIFRTVQRVMTLPTCHREFPRDIGKERPCVYSQMGRCAAPCSGKLTREEYGELIKGAQAILSGDLAPAKAQLVKDMERASQELEFELAAKYRDRIYALDALSDKQKVVSGPDLFADVVGVYTGADITVISVFFIRGGTVFDMENYEFSNEKCAESENIPAFLMSLYEIRRPPRNVLLQMELEEGDREALSSRLTENSGSRVEVRTPQRGLHRQLCLMVGENASHRAKCIREEKQRSEEILFSLAKALGLEVVPDRIEAYDISNFGNDSITAGMVVLENARFKKSDYRLFRMKEQTESDDYAAMREALSRRLDGTLVKHSPSYPRLPDLILLDGGKGQVSAVMDVLEERNCRIPVFGMVKDDHHKTRALCTENGIIDISRDRELYTFIYSVQEEVHRFSITSMSKNKRKSVKRSSLEKIDGIGPGRAKSLMAHFRTLKALKEASRDELISVKGITPALADKIIGHFSKGE